MKTSLKMLFTIVFIISFSNFIAACHTIQGAGQDLQSGGQAISNAASNN